MSVLLYLIPVAIFLGLLGLAAFLWALRSGQFDDMDGAANRILFDDEPKPTAKLGIEKQDMIGKPNQEIRKTVDEGS